MYKHVWGGMKLAARDVKTSVFECVSQCLLLHMKAKSPYVSVCLRVCVLAGIISCVGECMGARGV